mgnify:CR=1 FL=1
MVSLLKLGTEGRDYSLFTGATFCGIIALEKKRKYYFTVDIYPNRCLCGVVLQVDLLHVLYKQ